MSPENAARCLQEALREAVTGDRGRAAELFAQLAEDSTADRFYGVCCAVAEAARESVDVMFGGRYPGRSEGEPWYVHHLRPALDRIRSRDLREPRHLFSERFLVAHLNDDQDNAQALYRAAREIPDETHFLGCVGQLFADTAGLFAMSLRHSGEQGR
ncbi:hypothetical protein ACKI16_29750 [Streptomyces scabiei]|uniref:hypothetical protein n=1 Tax=Streptomyces scabiei TaxID=1930 RepID=UPI0038F736DA